jgi:Icc-related predicted phosphoesterase
MRLLSVADIHYHLPQFDWVLERAGEFDVVVLPGDHLQVGGDSPLPAQVVVVRNYLDRLARSTLVLAASGNHDLDGPGAVGEQHAGWLVGAGRPPLYVDGESVDVDGVRFTVCPWWDGPRTRALLEEQLTLAADDRPERWVWVYHSPPAGTRLCTNGTRSFPDPDLAGWIDRWQPDLVFCGHIHQAPWVEGGSWCDRRGRTWVFNPGHQVGPVPSHLVVDLEEGTATWFGIPAEERLQLDSGQVTAIRSA